MLITLDEAKDQVKIDRDDITQDDELTAFILAASSRLEEELQRAVYLTRSDITTDDPDALVLDELRHGGEGLKLALKLMIGHYFRNREQVVTGTIVSNMPEGFAELTSSYRLIPYGGRT
ncbi:head-tail connector protein [Photobacterium leiognathi]|uniref:head-tail connector protein n=1 Tax=Photobacterium leiognathi TaxID=553611 RepID=UPI000D16D1BD|nr:head-tail connector protein [Photobacterium leiognathi]PSW53023.1 hypothetical protein C0W50_19640 [Photobacterium leiognathi subsp. mandapamensis]